MVSNNDQDLCDGAHVRQPRFGPPISQPRSAQNGKQHACRYWVQAGIFIVNVGCAVFTLVTELHIRQHRPINLQPTSSA